MCGWGGGGGGRGGDRAGGGVKLGRVVGVVEVEGLRVLERVEFEEGGLVWDETVRVVVEEEGEGPWRWRRRM